MTKDKTETSKRNKGKQQLAKQRQAFASVGDIVKHYFPNYYDREYRYKEAKEAYFQNPHPSRESGGSKSRGIPEAI